LDDERDLELALTVDQRKGKKKVARATDNRNTVNITKDILAMFPRGDGQVKRRFVGGRKRVGRQRKSEIDCSCAPRKPEVILESAMEPARCPLLLGD
jgi:hypothetical protein